MTPPTDNVIVPDDDPFGTTWITQLANELFSNSPGRTSEPASTPGAQPRSTTPSTEAGRITGIVPGTAAAPTGLPTPSTVPSSTPNYPGLASGYPSATSDTHPPVHPGLQGTSSPATVAGTQSGGHDPRSGEAYPFGEPNCNGAGPRSIDAPSTRTATHTSLAGHPASTSSPPSSHARFPFPDAEDLSTRGFYFLDASDTGAHAFPASPASRGLTPSLLNVDAIRRDFPLLHQEVNGRPLVWLDNAATTQKPRTVIEATIQFYSRDNSNIHRGAHTLASRATELYEAGREKVQRFIGAADPKEIVFVRGTTEAINLVAQTYGRTHVGRGDEILLTTMEHHANIVPWQMLAEHTGATLRVAPINEAGEILVEEFAALLGSRTKLVAVTHVSNALGTINPVERLIALAHGYGVPVLVDGAQSTPHMPVNVQAMDCDFFVFSGHKIFGPTGIGALYGKAALLEGMPPYQGGGNMIKDVTFTKTTYQGSPQKFEAGTQDIAGVVGLSAAIDYVTSIGMPAIAAYEHELMSNLRHMHCHRSCGYTPSEPRLTRPVSCPS